MPLIMVKSLKKEQLEALIAEDGPLDGVKMMLFKNNITPTENTAYADLTPCDFTGYAPSADLVWGAPYLDTETGAWAIACEPVEFRSTSADPFVGNNVYGYAIYKPGTPNVLRLVQRFQPTQGFGQADEVLVVRPEVIGQTGDVVVMN